MEQMDLYWLAGILEGEGSFLKGSPSNPGRSKIVIQMTDEDVVARVAGLFGVSYHKVKAARYATHGWKPPYMAALAGRRAVDLMCQLRPLMGKRRQGQIDAALQQFEQKRDISTTKLMLDDVREIRRLLAEDQMTHQQIADLFGVDRSHVTHIKRRKAWKDVKGL